MALLYDWGFFIKAGKRDDFLAWLAGNESRLVELAPKNYEYIGTYRSLSPEPCDFHQVWRYGSERPPDLRAAAAAQAGAFTELAREYLDFVDTSREPEEEFRLYRDAVEPS
jgi:hypothetical protein